METKEPIIFLYIATGIPKPARRFVYSNVRLVLDNMVKTGRFVFVLLKDLKVYQWDNLRFGPMFNSYEEFIMFYKNEPIEFGKDNLTKYGAKCSSL